MEMLFDPFLDGSKRLCVWENILLVHFRLGQFWNGGIWRLRRFGWIRALILFPLQPYTTISLKQASLAKMLHRFLRRKPCFRFQIIRHHRKISWFILALRAEMAIENSEFLQPLLANSVVTSYGSRSWACRCHLKCLLFGLFLDEKAQILHSWRIHKHWHECCHWCGANWWHRISWHA